MKTIVSRTIPDRSRQHGELVAVRSTVSEGQRQPLVVVERRRQMDRRLEHGLLIVDRPGGRTAAVVPPGTGTLAVMDLGRGGPGVGGRVGGSGRALDWAQFRRRGSVRIEGHGALEAKVATTVAAAGGRLDYQLCRARTSHLRVRTGIDSDDAVPDGWLRARGHPRRPGRGRGNRSRGMSRARRSTGTRRPRGPRRCAPAGPPWRPRPSGGGRRAAGAPAGTSIWPDHSGPPGDAGRAGSDVAVDASRRGRPPPSALEGQEVG